MKENPLLTSNIYDGECAHCSSTIRKKKGVMPSNVPRGIPVVDIPIWCNTNCYDRWVFQRSSCVDTLPCSDLP